MVCHAATFEQHSFADVYMYSVVTQQGLMDSGWCLHLDTSVWTHCVYVDLVGSGCVYVIPESAELSREWLMLSVLIDSAVG